MKMTVDLWIEDGEQRMALIDTEAGTVLHLWRLDKLSPTQSQKVTPKCLGCPHRPSVQSFIKRLFHSTFKVNAVAEFAAMAEQDCCTGRCNR